LLNQSATSGSTSMVTTFPAPTRCANSAAFQPVPVPISNTRIPGPSASAPSMPATADGRDAEEVTSTPPSAPGCPSSTWVSTGASA
jgi:hypothetical protein